MLNLLMQKAKGNYKNKRANATLGKHKAVLWASIGYLNQIYSINSLG